MDFINVSSPNDGLGDKLRDAMVKVNANFAELLNTIDNLDFSISAIDGLDDALNMISASISGLQTQINTLDSRVDNHDEDISNINSDIVTVNSSISTINNTIAEILNDLEPLLDFTAEDVANKAVDFSVINNVKYPTTQAVSNLVTTTNNSTRDESEKFANKASDFSVINNVKYPTTSAVQNYVIGAISGLTGGSGSIVPNFSQVTGVGNTSSDGIIIFNSSNPINQTEIQGSSIGLSASSRTLSISTINGLEFIDPSNGSITLNIDGLSVGNASGGLSLDSTLLKFTSITNKVTSVSDKQFKYNNGTGSTTLEFLNPTSSTFVLNIPAENGILATKDWVTTNTVAATPSLQQVVTAGNVISATVSGDLITNTIQANQIRLRNVSFGAPIITINLSGYSVSSPSDLAVYGASTIQRGGVDYALPTGDSSPLATEDYVNSSSSAITMLFHINQTGGGAATVTLVSGTHSYGSVSTSRLGDGFYQIALDTANVVLDTDKCFFQANSHNFTGFGGDMIQTKIVGKTFTIFTSEDGINGLDDMLTNYPIQLTYHN